MPPPAVEHASLVEVAAAGGVAAVVRTAAVLVHAHFHVDLLLPRASTAANNTTSVHSQIAMPPAASMLEVLGFARLFDNYHQLPHLAAKTTSKFKQI